MDEQTITAFLAIGTIIFLGFFGNMIFTRYRVPDVLFLIALGMLIGPDILGNRFDLMTTEVLANINDFSAVFLSAALVIILFDGGLCLEMKSVLESMRLSAFMSIVAFILTMASVGLALAYIMDIDLIIALTLGAIVGGTSGAIVIPIVSKMRIRPQTKAMLTMESIMTDVLVIVVAITLISVVATGTLNLTMVAKDLISKFAVGGIVGFIAGVCWLFVLQRCQNQPLSYMITIAALFIVAGLVEIPPINSSGAVAALAFGLALGNRQFVRRKLSSLSLSTQTSHQIQQFQNEITFFVRTFFFVYLGLLFRFDTFTRIHLTAGFLIISVIVLVRWVSTMMAWKLGNLEFADAETVFASMPRGLAAAVLATLPGIQLVGVDIWSHDLGVLFLNTTLIVILGTTVLTTILSFATEKGIDRRQRVAIRERLNGNRHES